MMTKNYLKDELTKGYNSTEFFSTISKVKKDEIEIRLI